MGQTGFPFGSKPSVPHQSHSCQHENGTRKSRNKDLELHWWRRGNELPEILREDLLESVQHHFPIEINVIRGFSVGKTHDTIQDSNQTTETANSKRWLQVRQFTV